MKPLIYFFPLLLLFTMMYGFTGLDGDNPNVDMAPGLNMRGIEPPYGSLICPMAADTQGRLLTGTAPMNAGTVGADFHGNYFYINRWNLTDLYVVSRTGTIVRTMTYTGNCRDLTWRGDGFLYGGKALPTM